MIVEIISTAMTNINEFYQVVCLFYISLLISTLIVEFYVKRELENNPKFRAEEIQYKNKYKKNFPLEMREVTEKDNKCFSFENTPEGNVIMKYNEKEEGFLWWGKKDVKYEHLETVARKYVKTFLCEEKYIDRKKEYEKEIENWKKIMEKWGEKQDKKDEKSVFLIKNKNEKPKKPKAVEKANKFIHKGKLDEFELFKFILNKKEKKKEVKDVSWGQWINLN